MKDMEEKKHSLVSGHRRRFLGGAAATAAAMTLGLRLPSTHASIDNGADIRFPDAARYLRRNIHAPDFPDQVLKNYAHAVELLLALPPEDPRNWYRLALTHMLDCPHGNWWFLPWHRGYVGWFERVCRGITGQPDFALPYWDWSASPVLPKAFFQDVLDPSHTSFLQSVDDFARTMRKPLQAAWQSFSALQLQQLAHRGYTSFDGLWKDLTETDVLALGSRARKLSASHPGLDDAARDAVSRETLGAAMSPRDFVGFGSGKSQQHSQKAEYKLLEGRPHNLVHDSIGGLMGDFMSPCDPIFWLHHANIDRLWDSWIALQDREGLPNLPSNDDIGGWKAEPFEFFVDESGRHVSGYDSVSYASAQTFGYGYQEGTSVDRPAPTRFAGEIYTARVLDAVLGIDRQARGQIAIPADVLRRALSEDGPAIEFAVQLSSPHNPAGWYFDAYLEASDPDAATQGLGRFNVFGSHAAGAHHSSDLRFTLPLGRALRAQHQAGQLDVDRPLFVKIGMQPARSAVPPETLQVVALAARIQ